MYHIVEVDQSIKVEQSGSTILAFSNGISGACVIPSTVKNYIYKALRTRGKSVQTAYLLLFSAGLFLLLKDYLQIASRIEIDIEYQGKENDIRGFL